MVALESGCGLGLSHLVHNGSMLQLKHSLSSIWGKIRGTHHVSASASASASAGNAHVSGSAMGRCEYI